LLLKTYKNNLSLSHTGFSSSSTSCTIKIFFAFFINCISALLLLLKQKYILAEGLRLRSADKVDNKSGNAGSK
jgi:hypothetical protein